MKIAEVEDVYLHYKAGLGGRGARGVHKVATIPLYVGRYIMLEGDL